MTKQEFIYLLNECCTLLNLSMSETSVAELRETLARYKDADKKLEEYGVNCDIIEEE